MFYPMLVPKHIFSTILQLNFRRKHGRGDRMATAQVLHEEQLTDGTSVCTLHVTHCSREATLCLLTALLHYFPKVHCPLPYLNLVSRQTYHLVQETPRFAQVYDTRNSNALRILIGKCEDKYDWVDFTQKVHRDMRQLSAFLPK